MHSHYLTFFLAEKGQAIDWLGFEFETLNDSGNGNYHQAVHKIRRNKL